VGGPESVCYALLAAVGAALPSSHDPSPSTTEKHPLPTTPAATSTSSTVSTSTIVNDDSKIGTIIMPTFTSSNSEPTYWQHPPGNSHFQLCRPYHLYLCQFYVCRVFASIAPAHWHAIIREHMPPFDPLVTPTRGMGKLPETFRSLKGAHRSYHPDSSFTSIGAYGRAISEYHSLSYCLGDLSPLSALYQLNGYVLLLGVTHSNNTSVTIQRRSHAISSI
jgi:aminoglycoside N3'-acetyltransferase